MGCFDNLVALKGGCSETTLQTAGMYLNSIGIDRTLIESILTSDYLDVDDFVADKINLAIRTLTNDVLLKFSPKFNPKSIVEGGRIGFYPEFLSTSAAQAGIAKGIQLKLYNDTTFINLYVSTLSVFVNYTGTFNVLVYDLMSNTLLDTIPVTTVSGQITTVTVNKLYESDAREMNIIFVYDSTGINGNTTPLVQGYCGTCYRGVGYRYNKYLWGNAISIATVDQKYQTNLNFTSDTGGLSLNYSLQCNHLNWLCTNANFMVLPLVYKTGDLIMEHALRYTDQMNSKTILDIEKLEDRKEMYDFEYNKQVDAVFKNLRIPNGDVCFVCDRVRKIVTMLPA